MVLQVTAIYQRSPPFPHPALATNPPKWPNVYSVSGILNIPYAEISEPFYAWFDRDNGRSRIDYYGGMVKTYQLTKAGEYGTSLKVAPVSTRQQLNKETCLQVNGSSDNAIEVQSILPNAKEFKLEGEYCDAAFVWRVLGLM